CEITEVSKRAIYSALGGDADRYSTAIAALSTDADACTAVLKRAVANAADVDTAATTAIRTALAGLPAGSHFQHTHTSKTPVVVPAPPKGGTAEENRKYWDALTPEQQAEAIKTQPSAIGGMDGLPADVRHSANVTYLASERDRLEQEVTRLSAAVQSN